MRIKCLEALFEGVPYKYILSVSELGLGLRWKTSKTFRIEHTPRVASETQEKNEGDSVKMKTVGNINVSKNTK